MGYKIGDSFVLNNDIILNQHLSLREKKYEEKLLYETVIYVWTYSIMRDFFMGLRIVGDLEMANRKEVT